VGNPLSVIEITQPTLLELRHMPLFKEEHRKASVFIKSATRDNNR
jgi:hypothetical protein